MRLISEPQGKIVDGEIIFEGRDLTKLPYEEMIKIRGKEISMIFQEPMTSLNPALKVGFQISEIFIKHLKMSKEKAREESIKMIELVEIPNAQKIYDSYPHELSGGMRQRIMIAIALAANPKLLIADEPTTALDVTIQAQILQLMKDLKEKFGTSIMLITHDLGVVAEMADFVVVMYAGKVVEKGSVYDLFDNPLHPYTQGLLKSKPILGENEERLYSIPGNVPNPIGLKDSCYFHTRCEYCMEICKNSIPEERKMKEGQSVACFLYDEVKP